MGISMKALALALAILLGGKAIALSIDGPSYLSVGETPQDYSFFIENSSSSRKQLDVSLVAPGRQEFVSKPKSIGPKSKGEVRLRFFPESAFKGTSYTAKIAANLGSENVVKNLTISYASDDEDRCTVELKPKEPLINGKEGTGKNAISVAFAAKNASYKPKKLTLTEMKGGPQDWRAMAGGNGKAEQGINVGNGAGNEALAEFGIGGFEERAFVIWVEGQSAFDGELEFIFDCAGEKISVRQEVSASEAEDKGNGTDMLSGFAVVLQDIGSKDFEFALNAFLVIIAAVLLIAFIARLVHFVNRRNR